MNNQHHFDVDVAIEYGIPEAVFINHFQFWIRKNKANNKNFYDGRTWTFNSNKAFQNLFPYLSTQSIRTVLKHLIDRGVIMTGNYNQDSHNRTLWYSFVDENRWICCFQQMEKIDSTNASNSTNKCNNTYNNLTDNNTDNNPPLLPLEVPPKGKGNKVSELDFSFVDPKFGSVVLEWLEYKKERRDKKYGQKGFNKFYADLVKFSNNDPNIAREVIEQSLRNNWAGIFPLKQQNYGNSTSRPTDAQALKAAIDQSWGPGGDPLADIL